MRRVGTLASVGVLVAIAIALVNSCGSTPEKTRNDNYVPAAQQCVTDTDPACIGGASAMVKIPLPDARANNERVDEHSIFGHCELEIEGETAAKPCDGIRLVVRSQREGEVRTVQVSGYDFKFEDLTKPSYNLATESPDYDIITNAKALAPGKTVKIRVKAKPKRE